MRFNVTTGDNWLNKFYVVELVISLQFTPESFNIYFNRRCCDCFEPREEFFFSQVVWVIRNVLWGCSLGIRIWESCSVGDQKFWILLCFVVGDLKFSILVFVILGDEKFWIFSCALNSEPFVVFFGGSEIWILFRVSWGIRNSESFLVLFGGSEILNRLSFAIEGPLETRNSKNYLVFYAWLKHYTVLQIKNRTLLGRIFWFLANRETFHLIFYKPV